jgi:hypothetical protein
MESKRVEAATNQPRDDRAGEQAYKDFFACLPEGGKERRLAGSNA